MRFRLAMTATAAAATFAAIGVTSVSPASAATGVELSNNSGYCLWANASLGGGVADITTCNASQAGQLWHAEPSSAGTGIYYIENGYNQCLGILGNSYSNGADVVAQKCGSGADEDWTWYTSYPTFSSGSWYQNQDTAKYLSVQDSDKKGDTVWQWTLQHDGDQNWFGL
jgi:hypothetical protein